MPKNKNQILMFDVRDKLYLLSLPLLLFYGRPPPGAIYRPLIHVLYCIQAAFLINTSLFLCIFIFLFWGVFGLMIMEENWDPLARRIPSFGRGLRILLVDHDTTSLMYISSILESHSFKGKTNKYF